MPAAAAMLVSPSLAPAGRARDVRQQRQPQHLERPAVRVLAAASESSSAVAPAVGLGAVAAGLLGAAAVAGVKHRRGLSSRTARRLVGLQQASAPLCFCPAPKVLLAPAARRHSQQPRAAVVVAAATSAALPPTAASLSDVAESSIIVGNYISSTMANADSAEKQLAVVLAVALAVLCHESGHFLCARTVSLRSEEFSLGFGPQLVSLGRDASGTEFSLRLLPIGGYVRFGEEKSEQLSDGTMVTEFDAKATPERLLVLSGGILGNLATAWLSLSATSLTLGVPHNLPLPGVKVVGDVSAEALQRTGLNQGDILLRIGGLDVNAPSQDINSVVDFIHQLPAKTPVELLVRRAEKELPLSAFTIEDPTTGMQRLGIQIVANSERVLDKASDLASAAGIASRLMTELLQEQLKVLQGLFAGGQGRGEVLGPVGIITRGEQLTGEDGLAGLVLFFVSMNLNLAMINALPVPALDGGKALVVVLEQAFGIRLNEEQKNLVDSLSATLILALLFGLTFNDVSNIFKR